MKWFKHYSNARISNSLTELFAKTGFEGYGRYWVLLEKMSEKFNGENDDKFVFSIKDLKDILNFYHTNSLRMYLECMSNVGLMSLEWSSHVVIIQTPILSELQSRDFKKARKDRDQTAPKNKIKNKIKSNTYIKGEQENNLELIGTEKTIYDDVIQLWNLKCAGVKSLKHHKASKPNTTKEFFEILKVNPNLRKIATWSECFESIVNSVFLNGSNSGSSFVCTLSWLIDKHTIIDVLNGQYGGDKADADLFALIPKDEENIKAVNS